MEDSPNPSPNPKSPALCEECGSNPWKYRCPGCSIRTCGLPCVKSHKARTGCTGKRNRTEPVPISEFDDKILLSDYNLLEEAKRVADSARRLISQREVWKPIPRSKRLAVPPRLRKLEHAAKNRRIKLYFMHPGMSKRERNQSRLYQKTIFWTIAWRFHSTDVVLIDHSVDENLSFLSVIKKHLVPGPWHNQLTPFCNSQFDDLKFFLQKDPMDVKSPFRELDIKAPLRQQLKGVRIIEYPIIYVFLPSHSYDFEVEKAVRTSSKDKRPPGYFDSTPSPKGTLLKEEEIEEGEISFETKVTDLRSHMNSANCDNIQCSNIDTTSVEKAEMQISGINRLACVMEKADKHYSDSMISVKSTEDATVDFKQEFLDAYPEYIGELDLDDFLCLDGGFNKVGELEERQGESLVFGGEFLGDEELEEGEMPNY